MKMPFYGTARSSWGKAGVVAWVMAWVVAQPS
jgi:hypothetical protein